MQWSWVGDGGVVDASRFFFEYISLSLSFCLGCSVCSQGAAAGPCTIQWRDQNTISKSLLSTHWPGRDALSEKGAAFAESGGMNLLIAQSQCCYFFFLVGWWAEHYSGTLVWDIFCFNFGLKCIVHAMETIIYIYLIDNRVWRIRVTMAFSFFLIKTHSLLQKNLKK